MATSNLEALNELIQKIKAGERSAKSNLEALNLLCVIAGGTGTARSNLEALNELLTVFSPGGATQEKAVTITENGTTEITPDAGYTLSKATVNVNVPSVSSEYNMYVPSRINTFQNKFLYQHITKINLDGIRNDNANSLSNFFNSFSGLTTVIWGDFIDSMDHELPLNTSALFSGCVSLETVDLSVFKGRSLSVVLSMFSNATNLKSIDLDGVIISADSLGSMFYRCLAIEYIKLPILSPDVYSVQNTFYDCTALKTLILPDGCFSNESLSSLDLSYSPLTHDCAVDIFNKLATRTNSPTLKLSATTKGYLTDEEIAVATGKGWVIA